MRVQISTTAFQTVKSNSTRLCFLNVEDINFQLSVLELSIAYHQEMLYNSRSNKVYNHHNRRWSFLRGIHGALQMSSMYQESLTLNQ